jgi:hypothetical protein
MRQSATVQHIVSGEPGMRRLRNQSLNLPSEFGGGAAYTDMLMKNIALYQMRRIAALPYWLFCLSGPCFLDQCRRAKHDF